MSLTLVNKLNTILNIKLPSTIDDNVLLGVHSQSTYKELYSQVPTLTNLSLIKKSQFEGITNSYFTKLKFNLNSSIISHNNNNNNIDNNIIELKVLNGNSSNISTIDPLKPIEANYPICHNACSDCCEDMCEHIICCNCFSIVYDVWDEKLDAYEKQIYKSFKQNNYNNINSNKNNYNKFCYNPCNDCCEDVCEHAICCNCESNLISEWIEKAEIDNGGNVTDINTHPLIIFEKEALKEIEKGKKFCKRLLIFILLSILVICFILYYFLSFKPKYIK